jgi:hypothetical protein
MITEKNHKLLTSQLFVTDCTKKGLASINTKFVKDLPMIDAQLRFNQCNSFREEYISVFSRYGSALIL